VTNIYPITGRVTPAEDALFVDSTVFEYRLIHIDGTFASRTGRRGRVSWTKRDS